MDTPERATEMGDQILDQCLYDYFGEWFQGAVVARITNEVMDLVRQCREL